MPSVIGNDTPTGWIDTHCHFTAPAFAADAQAVRAAARAAGVVHCVLPAVQRTDFAAVHTLATQWGDSYALGIHPLLTDSAQEGDMQALEHALQQHHADPHCVAVGEIGLDFFVPRETLNNSSSQAGTAARGIVQRFPNHNPARQQQFYRAQLRLAQQWKLPVLLHVRRSADALLQGLRHTPVPGGIVHAFNGSMQQAHAFIRMGFKLGFGGAVTFPRALHLRRLVTELPLSAIVLETDAPDMPPAWCYVNAVERAAGKLPARNSPAQLPRIAAVIAQLRGISCHTLMHACHDNTQAALPRLRPNCSTP